MADTSLPPRGTSFKIQQSGDDATSQAIGAVNGGMVIGKITTIYRSQQGQWWTELLSALTSHMLVQTELESAFDRLETIIRAHIPSLTTAAGPLPIGDVHIAGHLEGAHATVVLHYDIVDTEAAAHGLHSIPVLMHVDTSLVHPEAHYSYFANGQTHTTQAPVIDLSSGSASHVYGPDAWSLDTFRQTHSLHPIVPQSAHLSDHASFMATTVSIDDTSLSEDLLHLNTQAPDQLAHHLNAWFDEAIDAAHRVNATSGTPQHWPVLEIGHLVPFNWHHSDVNTHPFADGTHSLPHLQFPNHPFGVEPHHMPGYGHGIQSPQRPPLPNHPFGVESHMTHDGHNLHLDPGHALHPHIDHGPSLHPHIDHGPGLHPPDGLEHDVSALDHSYGTNPHTLDHHSDAGAHHYPPLHGPLDPHHPGA